MWIDKLALVLLIIGGLNWGQGAVLSRIVYIVVALSAAWCISLLFRGNSTSESAA